MKTIAKNIISICIVDDSPVYRDALVSYFKTKSNINILFEAGNGLELVRKIKKNYPQVVLLDLEMPKMDGMSVLKKLRDKYPSVKFIMLTMHDEEKIVNSFLEMGANSFLNKIAAPSEIYKAIMGCYENDFYVNKLITKAITSKIKKQGN